MLAAWVGARWRAEQLRHGVRAAAWVRVDDSAGQALAGRTGRKGSRAVGGARGPVGGQPVLIAGRRRRRGEGRHVADAR